MRTAIQPSFDDLSTPLHEVTFCTLDLETTGGSAASCEITEIGAVRHRHGEVLGTFQTLVDPGAVIPPAITVLTGITHAMVLDAPNIESALPAFLEFLGDSVIVGHNVRFDMSFLNAAAMRQEYGRLPNKTVDTAALARRLIRSEVRNLRLQTLARHFRSPVTPNHRALDDALATAHVFHALLERAGSLGVTNLDDLIQLPKAKGARHYSKIRMTEHLPRRPGVYLLKDRHGHVIYVGKASNLRARVRQYFYGDTRRSIANLMKELEAIDHIVCASELEAAITEVRLIHAHRPRYNRRSRPPKASHFVKLTREQFPRLSLVRTLKDDGLAYLGPFRSRKQAELVMTAIWDSIPVRRCRGRPGSRSGKCAPAQLGVALCPCDGTLDQHDYENVIDELVIAIRHRPDLLLSPLADKMSTLSALRRYEEAAWVRDRHDALVRALESRQHWQALQGLGLSEVEAESGIRALLDRGRLIATWTAGSTPPLEPEDLGAGQETEVPPSVEVAEEARLIWAWLIQAAPRLLKGSGALALPITRPLRLVRGEDIGTGSPAPRPT